MVLFGFMKKNMYLCTIIQKKKKYGKDKQVYRECWF